MNLTLKNPILWVSLLFIFISCNKHNNTTDSSKDDAPCKMGKGVTDIDGNTYTTVIIGSQEWMATDLQVTKYRNGDPISNITDGSQWYKYNQGAWCYYNNDSKYNNPYGKLYNWYAVTDPRNITPAGWHVPSLAEWNTLIAYLGGVDSAGSKLKSDDPSYWPQGNTDATNSTCFNAYPVGNRNDDASSVFPPIGFGVEIWSTDIHTQDGECYLFSVDKDSGHATYGISPKNDGFPIRCIKD